MDKSIKIQILNCGKEIGTVGWLAQRAATINLGRTKGGNIGAWLCDESNQTITALAIRGFDDLAEHPCDRTRIVTIDRCAELSREMGGIPAVGADIPWTDAGFEAVSQLAAIAVEAIEAKIADDDDSPDPVVQTDVIAMQGSTTDC